MLVELLIENYAVVEQLRVRFHSGFHALTGETGSGKSIIVDALGLLFGGRASAEMVRSGAERARLSGIFELPSSKELDELLGSAGIEIEDAELLIEREVLANGKSRAFVASRPATAALLRELAPHLGDIHGQHDQQRLFSSSEQLNLLDDYAGTQELRDQVGGLFAAHAACAGELADLARHEQEKLRLLDLWTFQRNEIQAVEPVAGEDEALENELRVLQNVAKVQENASAAYEALYEGETSASVALRTALKRLEELARIDQSLQDVVEMLKPARIATEEASHVLRDYLGKVEADPQRLEDIQARLAAMEKLKRKYGGSIAEILVFFAQIKRDIDMIENASEHHAALEKKLAGLAQDYEKAALQLSKKRSEAGERLGKAVEAELKALAMGKTRFVVSLGRREWSPSGFDDAQFLMSANVGEEPKPLEKIASGGELSRVALALKTVIALDGRDRSNRKGVPRTLVFDEVDAGIGGVAAESVGKRLRKLAGSSQVLCVTHLAQIAGFANHQYSVSKAERKGRTVAEIEELQGDHRVREIGRMLSGDHLTPEALKHAEQLIQRGAQ